MENKLPDLKTQNDVFIKALYDKNLDLVQQKKKIEVILNHITEGIINTDRDFKIKLLNGSAKKIFFGDENIKDEEIENKDFFEITEFRDKDGKVIPDETILQIKNFDTKEYLSIVVDNRVYYIYLNISEVATQEEGKEYIISTRDVTAEKELERTKNDFVSVTSHELRTPMTIIKSYLWMLQNKKAGELNPKQEEYLNKAIKGSERMLNLINDTLSISRIERGKVELSIQKMDIVPLITEIVDEFRVRTDEKKIYLKLDVQSNLPEVYTDKEKMREIITNLLGNALKFTTEGGITVKLEKIELTQTYIKISVTDTGKGIDSNDIGKLFLKFGRLDNNYQTVAESGGTGLGLYIVKSLVEMMGGRIVAFSEGIGKGSTFWFTLPCFERKS